MSVNEFFQLENFNLDAEDSEEDMQDHNESNEIVEDFLVLSLNFQFNSNLKKMRYSIYLECIPASPFIDKITPPPKYV